MKTAEEIQDAIIDNQLDITGCNVSYDSTMRSMIRACMEEYKDQAVKEVEDKYQKDFERFKQEYKGEVDKKSLCLSVVDAVKDIHDVNDILMRKVIQVSLQVASERVLMNFYCGTFKTTQHSQYHQIGADNIQIDKQSILSLEEEVLDKLKES